MGAATANGMSSRDPRQLRGVESHFASSSTLQTDSSRCGQNLRDANKIVGSGGQHEEPFDQVTAAMPRLAQAADRLHPPERLFDPLALDRTDAVAGVTGRARIDRRPAV